MPKLFSALVCATALFVSASVSATEADFSGPVRIIDGDTLDVGSTRVRLHGIDTPEYDQACGGDGVPMWQCGDWVTQSVKTLFEGARADCVEIDRDRYKRVVARCTVDGVDMGQVLVESGMAFAYRKYSRDYVAAEDIARAEARGLHDAGVTAPQLFRQRGRKARETWTAIKAKSAPSAPAGCDIKGNISSSGERIYHVSGQTWYDRTVVSTGKGERFFCSEADARDAGWRRAKR